MEPLQTAQQTARQISDLLESATAGRDTVCLVVDGEKVVGVLESFDAFGGEVATIRTPDGDRVIDFESARVSRAEILSDANPACSKLPARDPVLEQLSRVVEELRQTWRRTQNVVRMTGGFSVTFPSLSHDEARAIVDNLNATPLLSECPFASCHPDPVKGGFRIALDANRRASTN